MNPYSRMLRQQKECRDEIEGYAVGLARETTSRVAYMTGDGCNLTNYESEAAVLPKGEAINLMIRLVNGDDELFSLNLWRLSLLVPVSKEKPLNMVTFTGF